MKFLTISALSRVKSLICRVAAWASLWCIIAIVLCLQSQCSRSDRLYRQLINSPQMDLTVDEPEERRAKGRRGRMAYFEEDQPEDERKSEDAVRNIQPPSNLGIAMRYIVYWSQVSGKQKIATHSATLDIDSYLLVADAVEMALQQLRKSVKDQSAKVTLAHEAGKWEARFATSAGLPRYDYPCRCIS